MAKMHTRRKRKLNLTTHRCHKVRAKKVKDASSQKVKDAVQNEKE